MAEYIEPKSALTALKLILDQTGKHVSVKVPNPIPAAGCIRIQRVGGSKPNLVTDSALVAVQVYSPSDLEAERLCNQARAYLTQSQFSKWGSAWVRGWDEVGGPAEFADPDVQGFVRWQFTGQLGISTK